MDGSDVTPDFFVVVFNELLTRCPQASQPASQRANIVDPVWMFNLWLSFPTFYF